MDHDNGRAEVTVTISEAEAAALDAFGAAVMAANFVEQWAADDEGQPYWYAARALMAALTELVGDRAADDVHTAWIVSGETVMYQMRQRFHRIRIVECRCTEPACQLGHGGYIVTE